MWVRNTFSKLLPFLFVWPDTILNIRCSVKLGIFQKVVDNENWFKPTLLEPETSNLGFVLSFKPRTFLDYLLPIPDFSYTTKLYFINRLAVLGMVWSLISTIYVIKSLTHCENSVAGSCDTECMCLMSLAFVSINLKAAAWPFLCLKNLPVCQVLEGIKEWKCFLKTETCVCVFVCVWLSH